jgi:hypothetical protein
MDCLRDIITFVRAVGDFEPQPYQIRIMKDRFSPLEIKLWLK